MVLNNLRPLSGQLRGFTYRMTLPSNVTTPGKVLGSHEATPGEASVHDSISDCHPSQGDDVALHANISNAFNWYFKVLVSDC